MLHPEDDFAQVFRYGLHQNVVLICSKNEHMNNKNSRMRGYQDVRENNKVRRMRLGQCDRNHEHHN